MCFVCISGAKTSTAAYNASGLNVRAVARSHTLKNQAQKNDHDNNDVSTVRHHLDGGDLGVHVFSGLSIATVVACETPGLLLLHCCVAVSPQVEAFLPPNNFIPPQICQI